MKKHSHALLFSILIVILVALPAVAVMITSKSREEVVAAEETQDDPKTEDIADEAPVDEDETEEPSEEEIMEEISEEVSAEIPEEEYTSIESLKERASASPVSVPDDREILGKYAPYLEINKYVSGWLRIDGCGIDDPVVYTPGSQNYFLHRALDGSDMERGTFFIAINWFPGTNNTLIYGHNMKDGSGFGSLSKYSKEDFGLAHPVINFDTLYEEKEYRLLAAFYSQIPEEELETEEERAETDEKIANGEIDLEFDFGREDLFRKEKDEDNGRFRYYYYTDLSSEDDFDYFIQNVNERKLYDTGEEARFGDELLVMSTCSYHVKNGRFVVVAVHHND